MQPFLALFFLILSSHAQAATRVLQVRITSVPNTLDWNVATSGSERAIIQNIMDGLFSQDVHGVPQKKLAKSYFWSADRKTLNIKLRTDVKWTDGKTIDASDFIFSFERLLDPTFNSQNASLLFDVENARDYFLGKTKSFDAVGIKAPTNDTLQFVLSSPRASFLSILTHWSTFPMRKNHPELTLGAFRVQSKTSSEVILQSTRPNSEISKAIFKVIPKGEDALTEYRKGKVDYLLQLEDSLITSKELNGLPKPGVVDFIRVVALLHLNPTRLSTNSPEKRRAIMAAIPIQALLDAQPLTRVGAPSIIPSTQTGIFSPTGSLDSVSNLGLTLAYPDDALSRSIAEEIQKDSNRLKIKIEALPKKDLLSVSKRYDLVLTLFGLDYSDPDQLLSSFLSQGTHDLFNVSNGDLLKLIQAARSTEDLKAREKLYLDAANLLENQIAIVMPLFYRRRGFLLRPTFSFDDKRQGTAKLTQIHVKK